ncbi:MAG: hypothetical protein ACYDC2_05145 [Solirubrobacteraceae bacterium]
MNDALIPAFLWSEADAALYRWVAPHPDWRPGPHDQGPEDWEQLVGSVLYDLPGGSALIDPLLPGSGRARFLGWLDEHLHDRAVSILTTIVWHRRDREELAARYRRAQGAAWNAVPPGVVPKPLRGAGETLYWLAAAHTLVAGDRLLGDGHGGLRLCPESWLQGVAVDRRGLARLMRPLLELPVERVLVSHGEPVLHDGRAALAHAIGEAEVG